ncbi:hypothetical protein VKT23_008051 [Stygiomarasmius scandens]|uniref:Uncharacterized protein n=1 Tax=Marasmiellus scandens TaxID=2682957 RepID=A0ABR1JJZ2_9AGAR
MSQSSNGPCITCLDLIPFPLHSSSCSLPPAPTLKDEYQAEYSGGDSDPTPLVLLWRCTSLPSSLPPPNASLLSITNLLLSNIAVGSLSVAGDTIVSDRKRFSSLKVEFGLIPPLSFSPLLPNPKGSALGMNEIGRSSRLLNLRLRLQHHIPTQIPKMARTPKTEPRTLPTTIVGMFGLELVLDAALVTVGIRVEAVGEDSFEMSKDVEVTGPDTLCNMI